jgi:23S rRNA (cytidine1920-2'-O)/16S rRNA (cytidine1409-2'-O)-methyltransferase
VAGVERSRLDEVLVARGAAPNRSVARGLIMAGLVSVSGKVIDKAGTAVAADADISIKERPRFVSRAGDKLDAALDAFVIDVTGALGLDVGASTGGFVDCLLQRGAARVIALDVGRGQLDSRLRNDPRVHVIEGVNARYLTPDVLPWTADVLTMDVSFISVSKVLPAVIACLTPRFTAVVLIKPQFEAGPKDVGKGGIVRDPEVHRRVLVETARFIVGELGLALMAMARSAVPGTGGNVEYFFHLSSGGAKGLAPDTLEAAVEEAVTVEGQHGEGARSEA